MEMDLFKDLPALKFSGDIVQYPKFKQLFIAACKYHGFSDHIEKIYLLQSIPAQNRYRFRDYWSLDKIWMEMDKFFGNKVLLIQAVLDDLTKLDISIYEEYDQIERL